MPTILKNLKHLDLVFKMCSKKPPSLRGGTTRQSAKSNVEPNRLQRLFLPRNYSEFALYNFDYDNRIT